MDAEQRNLLATLGSTLLIVGASGLITVLTAASARPAWALAILALILVLGIAVLGRVGVEIRRGRLFRRSLIALLQEGDALRASLMTEEKRGEKLDYKVAYSRLDDYPRVEEWARKAASVVGERGYFNAAIPDGLAVRALPKFMDERMNDLRVILGRV